MDIGFVGLGRMGSNMVERLLRGGHRVVAYNRSPEKTRHVMAKGAEGVFALADFAKTLKPPRAVWVMVPAGDATETTLNELTEHLAAGDLVIDGGNSRHSDSRRRAASLGARGLGFVDSGTSGGVWGLQNGYCLMVGGTPADIARLAPIFTTLAPPEGWLHCGPAGAGHFVKMVHNGIEYAMMQGYAEGFEILRASPYALDLGRISGLWNRGSVVRSWLLELAERAFAKDKDLSGLMDFVQDSGEGRWTVEQAIETGVPAPTIALSLFARFSSQQTESFAGKVLAALRQEFGGHPVKSKSPSA